MKIYTVTYVKRSEVFKGLKYDVWDDWANTACEYSWGDKNAHTLIPASDLQNQIDKMLCIYKAAGDGSFVDELDFLLVIQRLESLSNKVFIDLEN